MRDNLRLLVDPVYTTKNVDKCATFWWLRQIAEYWVDQGKDRYVYWSVGKDGEYDTESIKDDRWLRVPIDRTVDRYREMWFPPMSHQDAFNSWSGRYGDWDILLTTRNNGFYWRRLVGADFRVSRFLVLAEPFPFMPFKKTFSSTPKGTFGWRRDVFQTITSYLMFDRVHINTEYERKEIINSSRMILSASEQSNLSKKFDVTYPRNQIDPKYPLSREARESFMKMNPMWVIYPQRMDETERKFSLVYKAISAVHAKLMADGMNIRIQICTNSSIDMPGETQKDRKFILFNRPSREKFWERLKECHVFLSFAIEEGLPFSLLEAVQLGTIGVIKKERWSEDLFGKEYPWFVSNVSDSYALIKRIRKNPKESWSSFCRWYEEYFMPTILNRGNSKELFELESQNWADNIDENLEGDDPSADLILAINKNCGKMVDLLKLPSTDQFREKGDLRDRNINRNGVYFRMPKRWIVEYVLRKKYGWRATRDPWVLKRST